MSITIDFNVYQYRPTVMIHQILAIFIKCGRGVVEPRGLPAMAS